MTRNPGAQTAALHPFFGFSICPAAFAAGVTRPAILPIGLPMTADMSSGAAGLYVSGEYLAKNPTWHEEDAEWKFGNVAELVRRNHLNPASVVEVGTGSGEVLRLLADALDTARLTGYDISPDAIRLAAPKATDRLSFHLGNPFGQSAYDLAIALDVFEHVDDYFGFLRQMTALAPLQIYNIPLDLSVRDVLQKDLVMRRRRDVGHLHYFFEDTALATLVDTGHEVLDYFCHSLSLTHRGPKGAFRRWFFRRNPSLCARLMGGFSMTVLCRTNAAQPHVPAPWAASGSRPG